MWPSGRHQPGGPIATCSTRSGDTPKGVAASTARLVAMAISHPGRFPSTHQVEVRDDVLVIIAITLRHRSGTLLEGLEFDLGVLVDSQRFGVGIRGGRQAPTLSNRPRDPQLVILTRG